jgi:anti-sigma B factor antagonist
MPIPSTEQLPDLRVGTAAIAVTGVIDKCTVGILEKQVARALGHQPRVLVIDLTGVRFLSAAGVWALIQARAIAYEQSCQVYLRGVRPNVRMVLRAQGVDGLFPRI